MEQVTIRDIARKCKVGVSTVSRAMNNHPDINPETKEMILKVIAESNYVPNNSARNLKRSNAKAIAILVKGMDNMFFNNMISVIEEVVRKKKYACIIERVEEKANEVDSAIEIVKEKRLRGIIFLGGNFTHPHEKMAQIPDQRARSGKSRMVFARIIYWMEKINWLDGLNRFFALCGQATIPIMFMHIPLNHWKDAFEYGRVMYVVIGIGIPIVFTLIFNKYKAMRKLFGLPKL